MPNVLVNSYVGDPRGRCRYPATCEPQQAGNPVKRNLVALLLATVLVTMTACSKEADPQGDDPSGGSPGETNSPGQDTAHGPFFPECGGVSDQVVSQLTQVPSLINTSRNSVGCQWLVGGSTFGPHFSFNWYRGSEISEERGNEELTRNSVEDINIDGHDGFIAISLAGDVATLCEIGIQFGDDFIEWSVSFAASVVSTGPAEPRFPDPCEVAKELTRQSIAASR